VCQQAEDLIASCANGSNPDCQNVLVLVDEAVTLAVNCANGSAPLCQQMEGLVLSIVDSGAADVVACAGGVLGASGDPLGCHNDVLTAENLLNQGVTIAEQCASGQNSTCALAEHAIEGVAAEAEQCATAAAFGGSDPLGCHGVVVLAEGEVGVVEATVLACASGANSTCALLLSTLQSVITLGEQCALGSGTVCQAVETVAVSLLDSAEAEVVACADGAIGATADPLGCHDAVVKAEGLINTVLALAEQCASGQSSTCALVENTATGVAAEAEQCATAAAFGGSDPLGCHNLVVAAEQDIALVESTVTACVNQTNQTCATIVQTVEQVGDAFAAAAQSCLASGPVAVASGDAECDFVIEQQAIGVITLALSGCVGADSTTCNQAVDTAKQTTSGLLSSGSQTVTDSTAGVEPPGSCYPESTFCSAPGSFLHDGGQVLGIYRYFVYVWTDELKWGFPLPAFVHWSADNGVIAQDDLVGPTQFDSTIHSWFDQWFMSVYNRPEVPFEPQMTDDTTHLQWNVFKDKWEPLPGGIHTTGGDAHPGAMGCQQDAPPRISWTCFTTGSCAGASNSESFCLYEQSPLAREDDTSWGPWGTLYTGDAFVEPDDIHFDDSSWVPISGDEHSFVMGLCDDFEPNGGATGEIECLNAP
jgi:hypothetical protein